MTSAPKGRGVCEISKLSSIKVLKRGKGVKKVQKETDVICEGPLYYIFVA